MIKMRLRNIRGSKEAIAESDFVIQAPEQYKEKWHELFGNEYPLHIEIGMGKGKFLTSMAALHKDINYLGIEKYPSVLIRALEKRKELDLNNLYFLCCNAEDIIEIFAPCEVSRIYLNFSDPWPKDRHARRRLTSKEYFARYENILSKEGQVAFKTDNRSLFDFSLEQVIEAGWSVKDITFDLHHSEFMIGNIMTEYEEKFSTIGNPIHRLVAFR